VSEPKGREAGEDKLNRVQKGGLDIAKRELGGPRVLAYFGTDVDRGKGAVGVDVDRVVGVGAERSDEVGGCVGVEVLGVASGTRAPRSQLQTHNSKTT